MRNREIEEDKFYRWGKKGPIVFCTLFDLETFVGIVVKMGKYKDHGLKLGQLNSFNADADKWLEIPPKIDKELKTALKELIPFLK